MFPIQIEDWRRYRRDGEQFLQTALGAHRRQKRAFSADTLYNLTCMAIEKLIMAFLMRRGKLAENHTMGDLFRALEADLDGITVMAERFSYLDSFQEICDPDEMVIRQPDDADVREILAIGSEVSRLLKPHLDEHPHAGLALAGKAIH